MTTITKADYAAALARIEKLMSKGSGNLTKTELQEIRQLALTAEKYEHNLFSKEIAQASLKDAIALAEKYGLSNMTMDKISKAVQEVRKDAKG